MYAPTEELFDLAKQISRWAERWRVFETVYVFGSRVRGDHKPQSDLDLLWEFDGSSPDDAQEKWHDDAAVAELEARTGLRLHIPRGDKKIEMDVKVAAQTPFHVEGKVVCVLMPGK